MNTDGRRASHHDIVVVWCGANGGDAAFAVGLASAGVDADFNDVAGNLHGRWTDHGAWSDCEWENV